MPSIVTRYLKASRSFCQRLAGWRRLLLSFLLGCLTALAMPPIGLAFVYFLIFPAFIWLSEGSRRPRDSFWLGFVYGMGFFLSTLYWICMAIFFDFARWWWLLPLPTLLLPITLSLSPGIATWLANQLSAKSRASHTLWLIACLSLGDYLRGILFTGFPWAVPGYAWMQSLPVAQSLSWAGIYGLSLLTLGWAAIPAFVVEQRKALALASTLSLLCCFGWGVYRLHSHGTEFYETTGLRLVQTNIPQGEKWNRGKRDSNFLKYIRQTREPAKTSTPITYVIWPETALTFNWEQSPAARQYLTDTIKEGQLLLAGQLRIEGTGPDDVVVRNSLIVVDHTGTLLGRFDKTHLLPFGEYTPFRGLASISGLGSSVAGVKDFTAGTGPYTARIGNYPSFSPLICYEVAFPGEVTDPHDRPDWLLNIGNDAWFGRTAGPYQHLATAQARAIEQGLPMVRANGTGISAVIDAYGRILTEIGVDTAGNIDIQLPKPIAPTLYSRWSDSMFFSLLVLLFAYSFVSSRKRPGRHREGTSLRDDFHPKVKSR
jgi:apolipoprotein N-acyltransferase